MGITARGGAIALGMLMVSVCAVACADMAGGGERPKLGSTSQLARDEPATRAKRVSLIVGWASVAGGAAVCLLAKRSVAWWAKTLVYMALAVLALLPWLMLGFSTDCYWEAKTDAGRTTIQWNIEFWLIMCSLWYTVICYKLWADAYAALRRAEGSLVAPSEGVNAPVRRGAREFRGHP